MSQNGPSKRRSFLKKKENEVEEEILSIVEEGHEQGIIHTEEAEMISNILEFSDKEAHDVMTNRQKIVAVEKTMTIRDALMFALENNYSRYPVYEEDIDTIVGMLHLKDIIKAYLETPDAMVDTITEETMFIHPTYDISKLLKKMQKEKNHMAIVVDEYGQTEGIVALEDIIEEIVGNIFDEHDVEENTVRRLAGESYLVDGFTPISEIEDLLEGVEFPDNDIETLNGFLLFQLGRLPEEKERIEIDYQGYKFVSIKIENRMVKLVKIIKTNNKSENKE